MSLSARISALCEVIGADVKDIRSEIERIDSKSSTGIDVDSLSPLPLPIDDNDDLIVERGGTQYRLSIAELILAFGESGSSLSIGDAPLYMGYETMKMGE